MRWMGLLVALTLISCNHLTEGDIVSKNIEAERSYTSILPLYIQSGKVRTMIMVPYIIHDDEDYVVQITGDYKGEKRTETLYLTKEKYQCVVVGGHLTIDGNCSTSDNGNTKDRQ
jgi:hypothetical protein